MQRVLTDVVHCAPPTKDEWVLYTPGQIQVANLSDATVAAYPMKIKIDTSLPMARGKKGPMVCTDSRTAVFCTLNEDTSSMTTQELSFPSDIICGEDGLVLLANGKLVQVAKGEIAGECELNHAVSAGAFARVGSELRLFFSGDNQTFYCSISSNLTLGEVVPIETPANTQIRSVVESGEHVLVGWANETASCYTAAGMELISCLPGAPVSGTLLVKKQGTELVITEAVCGVRVKSIKCDKNPVRFYSAGERVVALRTSSAAFTVAVDSPCIIGCMATSSSLADESGRGKFKKEWKAASASAKAKLLKQLKDDISKAEHSVVTLLIECKLWDTAVELLPMLSEASMVRLLNARPRVNMVWAVAKELVTPALMVAAMAKLQPVAAVLEQAIRAVRIRSESAASSLEKVPELPTVIQALRLIANIVDAKFHEISLSEPKIVEEVTKMVNSLNGSMSTAPKMLASLKSFNFCPKPVIAGGITRVQLEI